VDYYKRVCDSLGLNPLTMPFSYILFREFDGGSAKLSLYANKSCTEQLRKIHGVSVIPPLRRSRTADIVTVEADVKDKTGRTDSASGSVPLYKIKDGKRIDFDGKDLCNAEMKCETKAKRRATLSICGLAFLDESELDTMEVVGGVTRDGRIYYHEGQEPQYRRGSHEASQKVLEAKLAGEMPLNTPEGPKAPPEPPAKPPSPSGKPPAKSGKIPESEYRKDNVPPPVPAEPWKYVGRIEFDYTEDKTMPYVRGDIQEIVIYFPQDLRLKRKNDWWCCFVEDAERIKAVAIEKNFEVVEILPQQSSGVPPKQRHDDPGKPRSKGGGTGSTSPSAPVILHATIENFADKMTKKKQPMMTVLLKLEKGKVWGSAFDHKLFPLIGTAKGKDCEIYVKESAGYGPTILGFKRIANREYDEDGITPVIQRSEQQPGKTLF